MGVPQLDIPPPAQPSTHAASSAAVVPMSVRTDTGLRAFPVAIRYSYDLCSATCPAFRPSWHVLSALDGAGEV
jgi:hypothetical protein